MDLNNDNIENILVNISCCISNLSKDLILFSQTGNKKCFDSTNKKILILNKIYKILKKNYQISYPIYEVDIYSLILD